MSAPRTTPGPRPAATGRVDCAVLVVTHNSAADIPGLLASLPRAAGGLTLRTIVVDNDSSDETCALVREHPGVTLVPAGANLGYAGGINVARLHAGRCDSLLVANPDLVLEAGAIAALRGALDDRAVGIAVPQILDAGGEREASLRREPSVTRALGDAVLGRRLAGRPAWLSEVVRAESAYAWRHPVDWACGAALLISAACDAAVGPWDERFFMYSEEIDYAARARDAGFRIDYVPTARVRHRAGGSGGTQDLIALLAVNRVRYAAKAGRSATAFGGAVALHELLRARDPRHRHALRILLRPVRWRTLPGGAAAR